MTDRINTALNYIASNFNQTIKVADLAGIACLSESQFHRKFKLQIGMTPSKYIESVRLNFAYEKLIEQNQNIQLLSETCGYNDYETFSRAFKKMYCLSPDDLAKIVSHIRDSNQDSEAIYVGAMDEEKIENVQSKLKQLIKDLNVTQQMLDEAQVFTVNQVKSGEFSKDELVKNKYKVNPSSEVLDDLISSNLLADKVKEEYPKAKKPKEEKT